MKFKQFLISTSILATSFLVICVVFAVTKLSPSSSPSSTYHSLSDIYTLITAGTEKATPNSALTTSSSPSATTSHSTTEIYLLLANKFKQENLRPGTNIFGITGAFGTPDAGYTLATSSAVSSSLTPTYTTDTLPTYTLEDIYNLVYGNTRITTPNHTFSSSPSASMYTTTQIYDALKNLKTNVLSSTKYGTTASIFGVTGTFEPTAQLNESCGSNDECYTGWCDYNWNGICTNGAIGDSCGTGDSCASGYCDDMNSYTCTDGSVGSGCYSDSNCASGMCAADDTNWNFFECTDGASGSICANNGDCSAPNICDTGTNTCVDGSNGAACISALGCSSGYCDSINSICTDGSVGTACGAGSECSTSYCDSINSICSSGVPGSVCGGNSECDTYNCVSNICSADLPPIATNLVGYWPFEETTGTTTADLSGNGHNGTLINGTLVNQTGIVGKAFDFDGTNDYVLLGDSNAYDVVDSKTVCAWIKTQDSAIGMNSASIISKSNWSNPYQGWGLFMYTAGHGEPYANSFYVDAIVSYPTRFFSDGYGPIKLNDGVWHNTCWVVNGSNSTSKLYIDGVAVLSGVNSGQMTNITDPLEIGARDGANWPFNGLIDEVAMWDRPLAPAEISNLYNGGAGMSIITP